MNLLFIVHLVLRRIPAPDPLLPQGQQCILSPTSVTVALFSVRASHCLERWAAQQLSCRVPKRGEGKAGWWCSRPALGNAGWWQMKEEIPRTRAAPTPYQANGAAWPGFSWHRHLWSLDFLLILQMEFPGYWEHLVGWDILPMPVPASSREWLCSPFTPAAAAKSLQSCPTLCDPIDGSPPGSAVPEILQASTLEWVAISFSITFYYRQSVTSWLNTYRFWAVVRSFLPASSTYRHEPKNKSVISRQCFNSGSRLGFITEWPWAWHLLAVDSVLSAVKYELDENDGSVWPHKA